MSRLQFIGVLLTIGGLSGVGCAVLLRAGHRVAAGWCVFANIICLGLVVGAVFDSLVRLTAPHALAVLAGLATLIIAINVTSWLLHARSPRLSRRLAFASYPLLAGMVAYWLAWWFA